MKNIIKNIHLVFEKEYMKKDIIINVKSNTTNKEETCGVQKTRTLSDGNFVNS